GATEFHLKSLDSKLPLQLSSERPVPGSNPARKTLPGRTRQDHSPFLSIQPKPHCFPAKSEQAPGPALRCSAAVDFFHRCIPCARVSDLKQGLNVLVYSLIVPTGSDPARQELKQFVGRPEPDVRARRSVFWRDKHRKPSAVQNSECLFITHIVAEICDGRGRVQCREEISQGPALIGRC